MTSSADNTPNPLTWKIQKQLVDSDLQAVQQSLEQGADVHFQNYEGMRLSLLHMSVNTSQPEMTKLLLRWGAKPDAQNIRGFTPFMSAVSNQKPATAELLLDYGADPDHRNKSGTMAIGETALHDSATKQKTESVGFLLTVGADPLLINGEGKTARERLVREGGFSLAPPALLSALELHEALPRVSAEGALTKADLFAKNEKGYCPLDNPVTWRKWPNVIERLRESGEKSPTLQELNQTGRQDASYLERALQARALPALVDGLNADGASVKVSDILGQPNLQTYAASRQVARGLFTAENTASWTPGELRQNLALLTEDARESIINLAQLKLFSSQNAPTRSGLGR